MDRTDPRTVTSPARYWRLIEVLHEAKPTDPYDWSLAIGTWTDANGESSVVFAQRWNSDPTPIGNPNARGYATWYVTPGDQNEMLAASRFVPEEKRALVRGLLGLKDEKAA
jgi:hypothetical protein